MVRKVRIVRYERSESLGQNKNNINCAVYYETLM